MTLTQKSNYYEKETTKATVLIKTSLGDFSFSLALNERSELCWNLINLAEARQEVFSPFASKKNFYQDLKFYDVMASKYIRTGSPLEGERPVADYPLYAKFDPPLELKRGSVVIPQGHDIMANHTEFIVLLEDRPDLAQKVSVIGHISQGIEVVEKISHASEIILLDLIIQRNV